jgi:DNA-binding XRE family transcriptional regulator
MIKDEVNAIRTKLHDRKLSVVAEQIGVHYMTLYYFKTNKNQPNLSLILKLEEYFNREHDNV